MRTCLCCLYVDGMSSLAVYVFFEVSFDRFFPMQAWTQIGRVTVLPPRSFFTGEIILVRLYALITSSIEPL